MPMYELRPVEVRFCTKDNKEDILNWLPDHIGDVFEGYYYFNSGVSMSPKRFHQEYQEIPGSML